MDPISTYKDFFRTPSVSDKLTQLQTYLEARDLTANEALALLGSIHTDLKSSQGQGVSVYQQYAKLIETLRSTMPEVYQVVLGARQGVPVGKVKVNHESAEPGDDGAFEEFQGKSEPEGNGTQSPLEDELEEAGETSEAGEASVEENNEDDETIDNPGSEKPMSGREDLDFTTEKPEQEDEGELKGGREENEFEEMEDTKDGKEERGQEEVEETGEEGTEPDESSEREETEEIDGEEAGNEVSEDDSVEEDNGSEGMDEQDESEGGEGDEMDDTSEPDEDSDGIEATIEESELPDMEIGEDGEENPEAGEADGPTGGEE